MNTKVKRLILKGILLSVITIPICTKLISLSKYEASLSQYDFYLTKGDNSYPGKLLRVGSVGDNVAKIQTRLNELGFNVGNADGIFGVKTKEAIMNFQKSKSLDVDGVIGNLTWRALFESTNTYPGVLIRLGSTGDNVSKLQQKLNELGLNVGSADGIFGNLTKTAVMSFQRDNGLDVDGIVGQMTWNLLFSRDEVVVPSVPEKEEPNVQAPSDSSDKDNTVEDSNNNDNSVEEDNNGDNSVEDGSEKDNSIEEDVNDDNSIDKDNSLDYSEKGNDEVDIPELNIPEIERPSAPEISIPEINKPEIDGHSIVEYAYTFQGCPYVWGKTGPDAFDSTGFTQFVYKNVKGIDIGRTIYEQIKMGQPVDKSELKPGDLIFPHSGHVAIYVGNGNMIHAPQTGDVIKISSVYSFYAARRII